MLLALTQLQEMYKAGYFGANALADTYADTQKAMASGKYAMTVAPLGMPADIEKAYPDTKADTFGFFTMPLVDNALAPAHPAGPAKFIYSGSKHIAEAKQYFTFLMKPENLQYLLDNTPQFPGLNFTGLKEQVDAGAARVSPELSGQGHRVPGFGQLPEPAVDGHRQGLDRDVHRRAHTGRRAEEH